MNRVILVGNLATEPDMRTTQTGISQCSFRLAVQRRYTDKQTGQREADFFPIIAWRQLAELCGKYLTKGRKVAIEGTLQSRSYEAQDGTRRYITEIIADSVEFLGSKQDGAAASNAATTQATPPPPEYNGDFYDDSSLPF